MKRRLPLIVLGACFAASLVFLALRLAGIADAAGSLPPMSQPYLAALSLAVLFGAMLTYAMLWRTLCRRLDGESPPLTDALAVFFASWLGRYVPSSLLYVAGKIALGERIGHTRAGIAASIVYENALLVGLGAGSGVLLLALALPDAMSGWLLALIALASVAGLGCLLSPLPPIALQRALRLMRRDPGAVPALATRHAGEAIVITLFALALNGAAFALLVASFGALTPREFIAAAAIFNLAGAAGTAAVPVPSGIGVREAVLIGLLHFMVSLEVAAASALLARGGAALLDLALGGGAATLLAARARANARAGSSHERAVPVAVKAA